jgi:hypothetical protein
MSDGPASCKNWLFVREDGEELVEFAAGNWSSSNIFARNYGTGENYRTVEAGEFSMQGGSFIWF